MYSFVKNKHIKGQGFELTGGAPPYKTFCRRLESAVGFRNVEKIQ